MKVRTVVAMLRVRQFRSAADLARQAGINILRYKRFESAIKYYHLTKEEVWRVTAILGVDPSLIADDRGSPKVLAHTKM